ncbi:hypothetical protein Acsp01_88580 [Actinoplanes sp. NBRC 101535]|nr:hypothetical protein Acsp01_88580 [Actinoplanes sp. NBRC 101535]
MYGGTAGILRRSGSRQRVAVVDVLSAYAKNRHEPQPPTGRPWTPGAPTAIFQSPAPCGAGRRATRNDRGAGRRATCNDRGDGGWGGVALSEELTLLSRRIARECAVPQIGGPGRGGLPAGGAGVDAPARFGIRSRRAACATAATIALLSVVVSDLVA